ncbi:MAG: GAF domain-containing protein [Planctomycetota bacterium]|nr:MAG: GAF domain-containing protein [Planctomycetota bacterium]
MEREDQNPSSQDGDFAIRETPISRFIVSSTRERRALEHPYEPGKTIANRYRVEREIGVGGMCTVYLVSELKRPEHSLALKVVAGETNPVRLETFRNEFRILVHLNHENLIRVFDFGLLPDNFGFFYTAEFIEGSDLLEANVGAKEDTLIDCIVQVCRALEYVHARGFVHYDVKPKNLLVTRGGVVKLTDFGLSALAGRGLGKRVRGTPAYTAPEIITGADIDHRADLYSLGVTLYEIITGVLPFRERDLHEIFKAHVTEPPKQLRAIRPDMPEYLEPIILRLLAKNPADRFDSANAVIEALAKARGSEIEIQPESSAEGYMRMPPFCGRDTEMETVRSTLDRLTEGRGGHILIEGPSGTGCTRFLREIHFEAQLRGCVTASGHAGADDLFEKLAAELATHPTIEPSPVPESDDELKTTEARSALPDTVAHIVAAAENEPVVVTIDDTHTALPPTRAVLERLGQMLTTSDAPAMLLITARHDTEREDAIAVPQTIRLRLRALTLEEVGEVTTRMFGRIPAPELFVSRLAKATGGTPRAVVETLRMLVSSGEIAVVEGKWQFRGGLEPLTIPQTLAEFYENQAAALRSLSHNLAFNIALLDRPAAMTEVSSLHDNPAKQIAASLGELERHGIIRRTNGRVVIANQGIRDALFATRTRVTLRSRHKLLAEKLAGIRDRGPGDLEIARHFLLGGSKRKGLRYGLSGIETGEVEKDRAAAVPTLEDLRAVSQKSSRAIRAKILYALIDALETRSDPETAIEVIEEYLSIVPRKEPVERRARMQRSAAEYYNRLDRPEDADTAWGRALELLEPGSSDHLNTLVAYAGSLEKRGNFAEAERILLDAMEQFGGRKNFGMVAVYMGLARIAVRRNQGEIIFSYAQRALSLARKIGKDKNPGLISFLGVSHMIKYEHEEAEKHLTRARQLAIDQNELRTLATINHNLMSTYFSLGKIDEARQIAAESETILRRYGNFQSLAHLYIILAREAWRHMGSKAAVSYMEKGLEYVRISRSPAREYDVLVTTADILEASGDFAAAIEYCEEADSLAERSGLELSSTPSTVKALCLVYTGNVANAFKSAERGLELALKRTGKQMILIAKQTLGEVALLAGDIRLFLELVDAFEDSVPKESLERRFETLILSAEFWFRMGQFGRVSELQRRIEAEPGMAKSDMNRGTNAIMTGRMATSRYRFKDAEKAFRTANHLHSADRDVVDFLRLRHGEVELELCRRDMEAAGAQVRQLEAAVDALPGSPMYYRLLSQCCRARLALLEGDMDAAYREAMSGMHETRGAGYRLLHLDFTKIAAKTSRDMEEAKQLRENAAALVAEMTEPLDESIRETVRGHLLAPPHESLPFEKTESGPDAGSDISEDLVRLAIFLSRENDPQRAIEAILDVAFQTLNAKRAFVVVREKDGLAFSGHRHASGAAPEAPDREVSKTIIERVIGTGAPVFCERAKDDSILAASKSVIDLDLLSILAVPVRIGDAVQGCLYLDNANTAGAFSPKDRRLAEYLASLAGAALDRQLLLQKSREAAESMRYRIEKQSAEFEIVRRELAEEKAARETEMGLNAIVGQSPAVRELVEMVRRAATAGFPVLLTGESGTGKDLAAKVLHNISPRRNARMVTVSCGGIPESLFEAELFGVERGAFTGAEETRPGLVELAHGGTLFLDELGDLPQSAQNALLRAVSEGTIRRVGGRESITVDVLIISASNHNLSKLVDEGGLRPDLLYRLNTVEIILPPLREREGDIPLLTAHFLEEIAGVYGGKTKPLSLAAMERLESYSWPGNVRELRNVLERAFMVAQQRITPSDLNLGAARPGGAAESKPELEALKLVDIERTHILRVFELNKGQIGKTAEDLGINRRTLRYKLAGYKKDGYIS